MDSDDTALWSLRDAEGNEVGRYWCGSGRRLEVPGYTAHPIGRDDANHRSSSTPSAGPDETWQE